MKKNMYGLLGRNIGYSLSPAMHNAAFRHFHANGVYELFDEMEEDLNDFVLNCILGGRVSGLNVTVPYKTAVKELLETVRETGLRNVEFDPIVSSTGSLNTLKFVDNSIRGCNTDAQGFWDALIEDVLKERLPKKKFFILGSGGAGRAICHHLAIANLVDKIHVYDVDKTKLSSLKESFMGLKDVPKDILGEVASEKEIAEKMNDCDVIVNATPLGTREGDKMPIPAEYLKKGMAVYDLVYARETELVKAAREKGLPAANGLGMLINQAALAFNIWTDKPLDEVKKVMAEAVKGKGAR